MPNRRQARTLVVSLGLFWAMWAIAVIGAYDAESLLLLIAALIGFVDGFVFYEVLFRSAGESFFSFRGRMSLRPVANLFRPSWIKFTLHETGWNVPGLAVGLGALLILDIVVAFTAIPAIPPHR